MDSEARRLILLRHAKSDWPEGIPDLERPLAERGVVDATAAGRTLAAIAVPDLVLCSPARRTRRTWELAAPALEGVAAPRVEPVIYGAEVGEILQLVRAAPADARAVLVIGHEPTMSQTARALAGPGSSTGDLARLEAKYPTSGMAVFRFDGEWADLAPAGATLEAFLIPRG